MSFISALKKSLRVACYGFCALTLLYSLIMFALYDTEANMGVLAVVLFYPLSFIIAFTNELLRQSRLSGFVRAVIRYVAVLVAFGLCICVPNRASLTGAILIVLFAAVTLIYVIYALIMTNYNGTKRKKADKKAEYKSVYGEAKTK